MRAAVAVLTACMAMAGVVDRVAVVVGNQVITESELLREVRLTEFMNGQPLDLSPPQRRAAADRLVDQQLIRKEMEIGNYPAPSPQEGDAMLRKFRQEHYPSIPQYRAALEKYGVTEDELKQHLLWQLAVMRFTDQRFHVLTAPAAAQSTDGQSADRSTSESSVDEQMDAWLKQQRSTTRIQFKKGAFEQ
jgi:parvulin-like peptidyl-prolyl isomerase